MILINGNFRSSNDTDLHCDLCDEDAEEETQMHLLGCKYLLNHPKLKSDILKIEHDEIFKNLEVQIKVVKI